MNQNYPVESARWRLFGLNPKRQIQMGLIALFFSGLQGCNGIAAKEPTQQLPSDTSTPTVAASSSTQWGFTPFPYDFTQEAIEASYDIIDKHATLFAIHRDDGIPWQEAYDDTEFPDKVRRNWDEHVKYRPKGKKVYLGLAPLHTDRKSLSAISEGSKTSRSFLNHDLDSPQVKRAYLNYVRRAVETFDPDYLNIGIEVGELADRSRSRWEDFEVLFEHVRSNIKRDYPNLPIGISFGLTSLMEEKVARRARNIIASSDYIGISFYPYISSYKNDAANRPPRQWMEPLNWLAEFADKPIAMAETGYATKDGTLASPRLDMKGSEQWQKEFLTDLAAVAKRDNYLFVAWFLPIDYEALSRRAGFKEGDAARLWETIGLFGADLKPKPAWQTWKQILRGELNATAPAVEPQSAPPQPVQVSNTTTASTMSGLEIGFDSKAQLFSGSNNDRISLSSQSPDGSGKSMQWDYAYKSGRFQWAHKPLKKGELAGASSMQVWAKSVQDTFVLVSFEEKSGEAYFAVLEINDVWKPSTISFSDLTRDENKKKKDGRFQPGDVVSITVADARGLEGARGKQTVWLANWQAGEGASSTSSSSSSSSVRYTFGFDRADQLLAGSENDQVSLSSQFPDGNGKSMQWDYTYKSGRFQWAHRPLDSGALAGGTEMTLWTKASQSAYVLVSFEEKNGEAYFAVVEVSDRWKPQTIAFSDLTRDKNKKRGDGRFQPENVVSVTVADASAMEGAKGRQSVWLANWQVL